MPRAYVVPKKAPRELTVVPNGALLVSQESANIIARINEVLTPIKGALAARRMAMILIW